MLGMTLQLEGLSRAGGGAFENFSRDCFYHGLGW